MEDELYRFDAKVKRSFGAVKRDIFALRKEITLLQNNFEAICEVLYATQKKVEAMEEREFQPRQEAKAKDSKTKARSKSKNKMKKNQKQNVFSKMANFFADESESEEP